MSTDATLRNAPRAGRRPWSREQVEALLRSENFDYQRIELPHGLSTGGHDRSVTAKRIFPADMSGKTVLDVGCSLGYYCFEALGRGAERAVGMELDADRLRKARLLADCLGAEADFRMWDIERDGMDERFDDVLCLNLLHHLKDPIAALDKLIGLTRERLILEVASLGRHDRRKVDISAVTGFFLKRAPVILVGRAGTQGRRQVQKFFMTPQAIETLLMHHRGMFARVDIMPSEHKDRFIAIAHKRRIGRLAMVAGPTSAGKSTFIRRTLAGELPEVAAKAGLEDVRQWAPALSAKHAWQPSEPVRERLLLHYDFLRPHLRSARIHERDEALDMLATAGRVTVLTLWTPPERLVRQISEGEIDRGGPLARWLRPPKRHRRIREEYRDPAKVIAHYRAWFDYIGRRADEHWIVEMADPVRFYTVEEWEREVAARYEDSR